MWFQVIVGLLIENVLLDETRPDTCPAADPGGLGGPTHDAS